MAKRTDYTRFVCLKGKASVSVSKDPPSVEVEFHGERKTLTPAEFLDFATAVVEAAELVPVPPAKA